MDDIRKIQCPCGQESQLVLLDGRWYYDASRHGNGEPCEGKCFNCSAPLIDDELFPAIVGPAETPEPVDEPVDAPEASMSMKRDELVEIAEGMGLEVPAGATKAVIIEAIEQAALEEQIPEDD